MIVQTPTRSRHRKPQKNHNRLRNRRVLSRSVLLLVAIATGCALPKQGILVMAHGGSDAWNRDVETVVAPLGDHYPVEIAFGMARTSTLKSAVEKLERRGVRRVAVVRMFISGDSFLHPTEYILGLRDELPGAHGHTQANTEYDTDHKTGARTDAYMAGNHENKHQNQDHAHGHRDGGETGHHMESPRKIATQASFVLSEHGVAASPLVDQILVDRVKELSTNPREESVLILAHGPADERENERWLANMRLRAQRIHELGSFRHVQCETLREDWPERRAEAERRIRKYIENGNENGGRVIVIPFRIAGFGPYKRILKGLDYVASERGFCPHPNMTRWIKETAEQYLATW